MLYDLALFLYFLFLIPIIALGRLKGKRHPGFFQRFGFFLPTNVKQGIWIHGVSVGEIKAASTLFSFLKEKYPEKKIVITTTTATGYEEAKRVMPEADAFLFAPIDFSFVVKRFVRILDPSIYLLVEGDFWPNLLKHLSCKKFLVSGRVSNKTASRWKRIPAFPKALFSKFDLLLVQSVEHAKRFFPYAGTKVKVTGNLKFDLLKDKTETLDSNHRYLTLSSTHPPEEELLLETLVGPWKILLAPRHPERFDEVEQILKMKGISYSRFSEAGWKIGENQVLLVDTMGQLGTCYANSFAAVIGGSFVKGIGGHNVLEPCLYGCRSLFGPYTFSQKELVQKVVEIDGGVTTSLETLFEDVKKSMESSSNFSIKSLRGASKKTIDEIFLSINSKDK